MGIIALVLLVALAVAGWYILRLRKDRHMAVTLLDTLFEERLSLCEKVDTLRRRNMGLRRGNENLFREKTAHESTIWLLLSELERSA